MGCILEKHCCMENVLKELPDTCLMLLLRRLEDSIMHTDVLQIIKDQALSDCKVNKLIQKLRPVYFIQIRSSEEMQKWYSDHHPVPSNIRICILDYKKFSAYFVLKLVFMK